jgi:hypothetical protein
MGEGGRCEDGSGRRNGRGIRRKCSETVVRKDRKEVEEMGGCSNPGVSSPVLALGSLGAATLCGPTPGQGLCSTGPQSTCLDLPITETGYGLRV